MSAFLNLVSQPEVQYLLASFVATLLLLLVYERLCPRRSAMYQLRTVRNVALMVMNTAIKLLLPVSLVAVSLYALFEQTGLLHAIKLGLWNKIFISWLVMDLVVYWLHRLYHKVDILWRFHRVHHSDLALDVTTPFRTHPVEMLMTLLVKSAVVLSVGMPLLGVILYEIIVAVMAIWIHANVRLHHYVETTLSWILVTPDFHRRHHGESRQGCNGNFGLILTIWDRLFGTFRQYRESQDEQGGVSVAPAGNVESFIQLLLTPIYNEDRNPADRAAK